jgi:hypothetical protein
MGTATRTDARRTSAARFAHAVAIAGLRVGLAVGLTVGLTVGLCSAVVSCTTYRDHLNRGQRYYDENDYEKALSLWRVLEPDMDSLSDQERARYCYLRGMTDYRLGYRSHARHWLAVAKAIERKYPGGLDEDWQHRADEALTDLNKDVYGVERFEASEAPAPDATEEAAPAAETVTEPAEKAPAEKALSGKCRTDSDCGGDQVCISRKCVSP